MKNTVSRADRHSKVRIRPANERQQDMNLSTAYVNISRPSGIDVRYIDCLDHWCRTFGVTRQQLCNAVSIVGSNSDLVRRHLRCGNRIS